MINYVEYQGGGLKFKLSTDKNPKAQIRGKSFRLENEVDLELFADEISIILRNKKYTVKGTMEELHEDVRNKRDTAKEDAALVAQMDRLNRLDKDSYQTMLAEEKDRILAAIELRERTDPNYRRPSWISWDERSLRGSEGGGDFLSDEDISKHFPNRSWNS